jgi:hypothetical protein
MVQICLVEGCTNETPEGRTAPHAFCAECDTWDETDPDVDLPVQYEHEYGINWVWFTPLNGDERFRIHKSSPNLSDYFRISRCTS